LAIIDYLLIVALDEENDYLLEALRQTKGSDPAPLRMIESRLYSRNALNTNGKDATVVVLPVGRMGEVAMQAATSDAIRTWCPRDVILIGIAGSLEPDRLQLGDVLVPAKVFGCTEAKATEIEGEVKRKFRKTGDRAASALINVIRGIVGDKALHMRWREACRASIMSNKALYEHLQKQDPEGARPAVHQAFNDSLASGTDVVASKKAAAELKEQVDSTICAVEMESRGVFEAVERSDVKISVLIVRGISDYADEDKAQTEREFKDGWRRFSMANAVRLALTMIVERPVIDESYCPLARPVIDLAHSPKSWELCAAAGIRANSPGATAIAFPKLISWEAGTPQAKIVVKATGAKGESIVLDQAKIAPAHEANGAVVLTNQTVLKTKIERSNSPKPLAMYLALPVPPQRIEVTVRDEFEREDCATWPQL